MTTKRKADLQRRLSMASVPKPPAGLAERIKTDIPDLIGTARERERLSSSVAFNLRVAASIILLISSAYLCIQLLSRAERNADTPMAVAALKSERNVAVQTEPADNAPHRKTAVAAPAIAAPAPYGATGVSASPVIATPTPERQVAFAPESELKKSNEFRRSEDEEAATSRRADTANQAKEEPAMIVAQAPAVPAPPPPPPAAAPRPALRDQAVAEKTEHGVEGGVAGSVAGGVAGGVVHGVVGGVISSARANDLELTARNEVFGISVDADAFARVKNAIERGERPRGVNVEALINYFAGPPERRAPHEVGLEVEASPAPVSAGPRAFIIRATVDTARQELAPGASVPPIATNARMEVELDGNAVISHRRAGAGEALSGFEPTLLKNVSVTALYEIELRSNLSWRQPIATVRLHYRSAANGREQTITRVVRASDVARPWIDASRRHRLASLGATWGETLKNAPGAPREATEATAVARRAVELANQEPRDTKARELAVLASASSRLQSSAPTGSGR
jgi:hypothetical protein